MKRFLLAVVLSIGLLCGAQDIANYSTLKTKSLVTMAKVKTDQVAVTTTIYDQFGSTSVSTVFVNISDVTAQRAAEADRLAKIDAYLTDLNAAR